MLRQWIGNAIYCMDVSQLGEACITLDSVICHKIQFQPMASMYQISIVVYYVKNATM